MCDKISIIKKEIERRIKRAEENYFWEYDSVQGEIDCLKSLLEFINKLECS